MPLSRAAHPGIHYPVRLVAGSYVGQGVNGAAMGAVAGVVDRLEFYPFIPSHDLTIDRLGVRVTTGAAGKLRVGIYTDANGMPDQLVYGGGELDTGTAGVVEETVSIALSANRYYWRAIHYNTTAAVRAYTMAGALSIAMDNTDTGTTGNTATRRHHTVSYAALAATAPANPYLVSNAPPAHFVMRVA